MGFALREHAIHRDLLAGFDDHGFADLQILDRHLHGRAIAFHECFLGAERQQRFDRALRAVHRVALQDIREAEKKQQQGSLEGCADGSGAERGEHHQHIHIEHPFAQ